MATVLLVVVTPSFSQQWQYNGYQDIFNMENPDIVAIANQDYNQEIFGIREADVVRSTDGGASWKIVFTASSNLEGMAHDQINDKFYAVSTDHLYAFKRSTNTLADITDRTPNASEVPNTANNGGSDLRDPWQWPFDKTSIWNMPIGTDARYVDAQLEASYAVGTDIQHLLRLDARDPQRAVLATYDFKQDRCSSSDELGFSLPIPDNYLVPDAGNSPYGRTPNSNFAFLLPDDSTLFQGVLMSRCTEGGPIYMGSFYRYPNNRKYASIYGDGLTNSSGQGASSMSSLGGTLRKGELTGGAPIRHAIKINPWAQKYLHYSEAVPGYRWPAKRADAYADDENQYLGSNPKLVMGSLLAIPPGVTEASLGLTTEAGKKLFFTLQNYGAYFTEDAAWNTYDLIVERDAEIEFEQEYGFSLSSDTWKADFLKLIEALHIVDNNAPTSIGGGGTPLQPLAPDFIGSTHSANLLANGSFEADGAQVQRITSWNTWSGTESEAADYTESYGSQTDGDWHLTHYNGQAGSWNCYTSQLVTGLDNGTYTLRAKARKSGSGSVYAQIGVKDFGGTDRGAAIPASSTMQLVEMKGIEVTNGQCRVGLWTDVRNGSNWPYVHLDEFELVRQESGSPTANLALNRTATASGAQNGDPARQLVDGIENTDAHRWLVYPNPARGELHVRLPGGRATGELVICDVLGQEVLRQAVRSNRQEVDVANLIPGLYTIRIQLGEEIATRKVIIAQHN